MNTTTRTLPLGLIAAILAAVAQIWAGMFGTFVGSVASLSAQTTSVDCSLTPVVTETLDHTNTQLIVGWSEKMTDGTAATSPAWTIVDKFNGAAATAQPGLFTRATTTPNALGLYCYTAPFSLANGTHIMTVRVAVGSAVAISNEITVTVSTPVITPVYPASPRFIQVK